MNKKVIVTLLLATLFVTTFTVIVKPAHATAYGVHFLNPFPFNSLFNIINFGPLVPGDHVHILAGHVESLPAGGLVIGIPNLWIYGAPTGVTPSIDINGGGISISAPNVFIYGLDFWDSTATSVFCFDLTPAASSCTIRTCSIRGNGVLGSMGILVSNSPNNLIACNTIRDWAIGIAVTGPGPSIGNVIKLNNIDYSILPPFAVGVQIGGMAGLGSPNRVCWNNIFAFPSPPGLGQELWDITFASPLNLFDDSGLLPHSFGKGNFESSWAIPPVYSVLGPGTPPIKWFDTTPLVAPMFPLKGDINLDGWVDIFDAILLSNAFAQAWCMPKWDTRVDLKPDGVIDIYDAILLASAFNSHY